MLASGSHPCVWHHGHCLSSSYDLQLSLDWSGKGWDACPCLQVREEQSGRPTGGLVQRLWWRNEGLSQKTKISIYWSIYVPTLTYGHELTVVIDRTKIAKTYSTKLVSLQGGRTQFYSSIHVERSQLRWFRHLVRMPPRFHLGEVFWACPSGIRLQSWPRTR